MPYKELLSLIAIVLTLISFFPYIRSIHKGQTKPHVITWVIWGLLTVTVFMAQLADKGGIGAWPIGISGLITIYVAVLAFIQKNRYHNHKKPIGCFSLWPSPPYRYGISHPIRFRP